VQTGDLVLDRSGQLLELGLLAAPEHDTVLIIDGVRGLTAEPAAAFHASSNAELDEPVVDRAGRLDLNGRDLADVDPLVGVAHDEAGQPAMADRDELAVELHASA
jgi:hypothetical protein